MDPRTPVVVGAAQLTHREAPVPSTLDLMAAAARAAAVDAGAPGLLTRAGIVAVVDPFSWPVPDPGTPLARELGITPRETWRSVVGGTGPAALLGELAQAVQDGDLDVALLAGGEAFTPFSAALREGHATGWPEQPDGTEPDRLVGVDGDPQLPAEAAAGLIAPIFFYPLFEQALRGAAGRTPDDHQAYLGRLWARFAETARTNPHAWSTEPPTDPRVLATPSPDNRRVSLPYPKLMNANIQVDQAAALVLCSAEAARAHGVPRDRWVPVHAVAGAHDHWHVGTRDRLDRSPALAATGRAALRHAEATIDDIALLDLYSCFPSAVQVAGQELGVDLLDPARAPTVTGGLAFAGGPANNYVTHALATMVARLREDPGALGLATGVGWYLTKHASVVLGAREPARPFADLHPQAEVDALPRREVAEDPRGTHAVETYTALFDRDGTATMGIVAALDGDGRRLVARSEDRDVVAALVHGDALGRRVVFAGSSAFGFG
jgi:acetyl-CoA C-acetyltransferase